MNSVEEEQMVLFPFLKVSDEWRYLLAQSEVLRLGRMLTDRLLRGESTIRCSNRRAKAQHLPPVSPQIRKGYRRILQ
jgi:hypothetical protein